METIAQRLAGFIAGADFNDLPADILHETKRALLDSTGCAIGGLSSDMGKIVVKLAKRLGGPNEATIIGNGDKVSCANAAFANGELINALDFDAALVNAPHSTPVVIAGALALTETVRATGKDLLLSIAVGHEVGTRLNLAAEDSFITTRNADGSVKIKLGEGHGFANTAFAAAASAGKMLNLSQDKLANALGITGYTCPPNVLNKFTDVSPIPMTKYGVLGWGALSGVTSVLLADTGFTGDIGVFDGEQSFWKYSGNRSWTPERVTEGLGEKWLHKISYKQYPVNGPTAGAIDCFIRIINENNIQPDEIDKITARVWPIMNYKYMQENKLNSPDDFYFNVAYNLTCAAHRIDPVHWVDTDVRHSPKLQEFMKRVVFDIGCDEKEFDLARRTGASLMSAEVVARGNAFKRETSQNRGAPGPQANTDDELVKKFKENVRRVLSPGKAESIVTTIFELEKLTDTTNLMKMLSPYY